MKIAGARVTLVGAGIVNLMTALELVEHGAEVEILDARPDPRTDPPWQRLGTTHGGANARMFSATEADNYQGQGRLRSQIFRRTVTEGGWLAIKPSALDLSERAWIERFYALPQWQAETFAEDIHAFNLASELLWQSWRQRQPQLFEDVGYTPGVLRLETRDNEAEATEALHRELGSLERVLDADELSRRHPVCRDAIEDGWIVRGLELRGFTLEVHHLVRNLLRHLEARGVRLSWNHPVTALERSADGQVSGLKTAVGVVRSKHYVLSPGVYGGQLLEGTRSAGKIQGILGLWLTLPNLEPRLERSIKLHREGRAGEDANINLATDAQGRPVLILGSGYGFLGGHSLEMDSPQIERLFQALEDTSRRLFPRAYAQAVQDGTLKRSRQACIRPFTSTGLGLFEVSPTASGGQLVIASGHNTGGFAQAPVVAEAVRTTLEGRKHEMQTLYDPERGILPKALMD